MESSKVTIRVQRFDPEKDDRPRDQDYELELPPGITILQTLNKIRAELDPTLAFRYSCGSAICGSCAMQVNGHARLACKTQASDCMKDGVMQVGPMGNMRVLRDLVVDLEPFWGSVGKVQPYLVPDAREAAPEKERNQTPAQFLDIDPSTTCILCGSCYSDCNVLGVDETFLGPAALAKAHRFIFDSRDSNTHQRMRNISEKTGVWECTHCGECVTRCPTETKPLERIEEIRVRAMATGHHGNAGARHVLGFRESIGKRGILNEGYLLLRSVGFFNIPGLLSLLPGGLRMAMRGKTPPILPHTIDKVDEVKKTFARFEELRK